MKLILSLQVAFDLWNFWYGFMRTACIHGSECAERRRYGFCGRGPRLYTRHVFAGEAGCGLVGRKRPLMRLYDCRPRQAAKVLSQISSFSRLVCTTLLVQTGCCCAT